MAPEPELEEEEETLPTEPYAADRGSLYADPEDAIRAFEEAPTPTSRSKVKVRGRWLPAASSSLASCRNSLVGGCQESMAAEL